MIESLSHNTALHMAVIACLPILGGLLSRWHGGGFVGGSPKILKAFLWSIPFALFTIFAHFRETTDFVPYILGTTVLVWCMVFKNTGHGGGMDLAHNEKEPGAGRTPEKLEYLILWLHGRIDQYRYDLLLLTIIGAFSTAAPAIAIGWEYPIHGLLVFLGGAIGKPLGYALGWKIYPNARGKGIKHLDEATAIGEFLTGVFAYGGLAIAASAVL